MSFDPALPVRTRNGLSARVICTDANSAYPIIALVTTEDETECIISCDSKGRVLSDRESPYDLVNVPRERHHAEAIERWAEDDRIVCEYQDGTTSGWDITAIPAWEPYTSYRLKLNGELIFVSLAKK